VLRICQRQS